MNIAKRFTEKDLKESDRRYTGICLESVWKTTKSFNPDNHCPGRNADYLRNTSFLTAPLFET
jgi:hypothetical protein